MTRGSNLLQQLTKLACRCHRGFSALAEPALQGAKGPDVIRVSQTAPVLLSTPERMWGATAILNPAYVPAGETAERLAVVRDAFAESTDVHRPLSSLVAALGKDSLAVAAEASEYHRRLVVDEYKRGGDGQYVLQNVATDLYRMLKREGVRVVHVPDVQAAKHALHNSARAAASRGPRQSTNEVLMVAPTAFGFNSQAAQDNTFMHSTVDGEPAQPASGVTAQVLREFSGLHRELSEVAGVKINLFQHNLSHGTPDAVFPNNWFSTHPAGEAAGGTQEDTLVFYPMKCQNRAMERRLDIQGVLRSKGYSKVVDLSAAEKDGKHFEGTGVLVLDRINGVAYVALSERADKALAEHWADRLGYKDLVTFHSTDRQGNSVYHTNVMMAIGTDVAVVCLESVDDPQERKHLRERLSVHHQIVEINRDQMAALCGNVLELEDGRGLPVMAMSSQAFNAFTPEQRKVMRQHVAELHHAPIDTLEHIGGGGVRCALGEIF